MDHQGSPIDATDLQADDYALLNSLSVDSQVDISPLFADFQNQIQVSPAAEPDSSNDEALLPSVSVFHLDHRTEQPNISKSSIELLAVGLRRENAQAPKLPTSREFSKLKLEHPLPHEYAYRELVKLAQERRRSNRDVTGVPSEPLSVSNDESLNFPESSYQYRQRLTMAVHDEKLDILKETLYYLFSILRDEWTQDKHIKLIDELTYMRESITPPLSSAAQDEDYFIPNEETCEIPISSDPSTLLEEGLSKAEANLPQADGCQTAMSSCLHFETPNLSSSGELPLLEPNGPNLKSLKIDGPLTPFNSTPPSLDLVIDMSASANGVDIDQVSNKGHHKSFDTQGGKDYAEIFNDETLAALKEKAVSVRRSTEQEQLQAADAIARIQIPQVDFSIPDPEWQKIPSGAASQLAWIEKTHVVLNIPSWPKNSEAERGLRWSPFDSRVAHISTNELIESDHDAEALLNFPIHLEVLTSADYIWKQPGLAVLREGEEEDEEGQLEPSPAKEDRDIESLVRKRKYELGNLDLEHMSTSDSASPIDLVQIPKNTASASFQTPPSDHDKLPRLLLGCNDPSATSTLLSNYVDFHTAKRQKQAKSSFFPTTAKPVIHPEVVSPKRAATTVQSETAAEREMELEQEAATPAPCPILRPAFERTKIIKALTLSRGVFSLLEKLYPNAEIIERDFDRWNTLTWDRNSVSRSPVASPLAAEADVIVSPTTGIVITTLLKAMQKPLPGHKGLSAIRERIRSVAVRYERLVILVSEANRVDDTARELTLSECAGYTDFAGFVAGLDVNAQTYYVGGGDDTLAKWLVSFATCYAPEAAEVQDILIQDETLWELFLRRAGMNAYAAQAVLGQLKAPGDAPEEEAGQYGLSAFVRMTPMERVQNFGRLMGGERVLNRVNEVLETRWG
ncbi:hypothetical protein F4818DRAFT_453933 [Hypoxylon cercidicola]|nr:hypothetical protein F4818DRAFT_453933 [Hypoxylon cercidicola]